MNVPLTGTATLTRIGDELALILPSEAVDALGAVEGAKLSFRRTATGIELTPADEDHERTMRIARDIMDRYRNALRELAK